MNAIVLHENVQQSVAFCAGETEKMHIGIVDAHNIAYHCCLARHKVVVVQGNGVAERACTQVETIAIAIAIGVGSKADKLC